MTTKTLHGPAGLRIELDSEQIFPDNPGAGTPAMVYRGRYSATYDCAYRLGELDCGTCELSAEDMEWIDNQFDIVEAFIVTHGAI